MALVYKTARNLAELDSQLLYIAETTENSKSILLKLSKYIKCLDIVLFNCQIFKEINPCLLNPYPDNRQGQLKIKFLCISGLSIAKPLTFLGEDPFHLI